MAFSRVIGALRRRWYIMLVGLIATAGLGFGIVHISPPEFTTRGLVLLLPPVGADTGTNPFLALGNLEIPARVVVAAYSSNAVQEEIAARAPDAEVAVSMEESTRGPVIAIDVKDTSADGAMSTLAYMAQSVPDTLARLQNEVQVPQASLVTSMSLTMDVEAKEDASGLIRLLIAGVAVGLALTVVAVYALDSAMSKRQPRRKTARSGPVYDDVDDLFEDIDPAPMSPQRYASSPVPATSGRRVSRSTRQSPPS